MAARTIEAFKLRTELIVDGAKGHAEWQKFDKRPAQFAEANKKAAKEADTAWASFFKGMSKGQEQFQGGKIGKKFGEEFGSNAVTAITGTIGSIGQTIGALIGTGIAPGIGTAIGSTIGSGIDTVLQKVSGPILQQITNGIELNKLLERSRIHFTTFVGDEKEAIAHLEDLKKLSGDTGLRMGVLVQGSQRLEEFTSKLGLTRLFMRAAADQSAEFYGDATVGFDDMADALGRIVLKGEDVSKLLKKLEGQGVHWKTYVAEGLGITEKKAQQLIKAGRIKGEGIATLVAQGIERHAGGFAQMVGTVGPGVEQRAGALMEIRAAEGTEKITGGIGDAYRKFAELLASPEAKKVVAFIDKMGGYVVNLTESAVKQAVSVGGGIAEGIMNFNPSSMTQSFSKLAGFVDTGLKTVFEIQSPSERSARVIGEPVGHGIGEGMVRKFKGFIQGEGRDQIVATLEQLLKDPKIKAFLDTIQWAEGGAPNRIVGGKTFSDLSHHPNIVGLRTAKGPSTAAGSFQITGTNDRRLSAQLGLPSFDAHSQALKALAIIAGHPGGLQALMSGDIKNLERFAALDWTSTPGSKIGGGGQKSETSWMSHFNQFMGGKAIDSANPMPVYVVRDLVGGASVLLRQDSENSRANAGAGTRLLQEMLGAPVKELTVTYGEQDAAIVDVIDRSKELISTTGLTAEQMAGMGITLQKLTTPIIDVTDASRAAYATNADIQKKNRALYISNIGLGQEIVGAFQSISGMIPGQQVGKKRGLFSKILGIAAPFLAFIPGIGPILSTIAGAASNITGGNYSAAVSGIAGGFQTGGVFRSSGGSSKPSNSAPPGHAMGLRYVPHDNYLANLHRGERVLTRFENENLATSGGGGAAHPELLAMLDRLHSMMDRYSSVMGRLDSMPAHEIVRMGAKGLTRAMDSDAGLANQMGRRLNFG